MRPQNSLARDARAESGCSLLEHDQRPAAMPILLSLKLHALTLPLPRSNPLACARCGTALHLVAVVYGDMASHSGRNGSIRSGRPRKNDGLIRRSHGMNFGDSTAPTSYHPCALEGHGCGAWSGCDETHQLGRASYVDKIGVDLPESSDGGLRPETYWGMATWSLHRVGS